VADVHISTVIREYATTAGIAIAGGWALWRWWFEEWLRRHRDFPALDGDLSVKCAKAWDGKSVITLNALWRNRGKLPVELNPAKTFVAAYRVNPKIQSGPLELSSAGLEAMHRVEPFRDNSAYILEPGTDSIMQQCFVLADTEVVLFHWAICIAAKQKAYPSLKEELWCTRYIVWTTETSGA
jgi:hypothetical protein